MNPSAVTVEAGQPLGMEPLVPSSQQQQQQTSVLMLNTPSTESAPLIQSFVGYIVLACCTFWCCGVAFGLAAFILAVMAQNLSTSPVASDRVAARKLANASLWVSVAGIIIGTILLIVGTVLAVYLTQKVMDEMEHQ